MGVGCWKGEGGEGDGGRERDMLVERVVGMMVVVRGVLGIIKSF